MTKRKKTGPTAERFIEATLELITKRGSSTQVNLREVSRRIGCAHTNAYNYFESREDLMWQAFRRVLRQYYDAISSGLDDSLSERDFFRGMFCNMIEWSLQNPGLHRFISSDPIDPDSIPRDIIETVIAVKEWIVRVLKVLAHDQLDEDSLTRLMDITLAYVDGEVFNLINGRVLPGEDVAGRVVDNLERLFILLTAKKHDGILLDQEAGLPGNLEYPKLALNSYNRSLK